MDDGTPTQNILGEDDASPQVQAPIFPDGAAVKHNSDPPLVVALGEKQGGVDDVLGEEAPGTGRTADNDMLRRRQAETLPLLDPTLGLADGPSSFSPFTPPSSFASASSPFISPEFTPQASTIATTTGTATAPQTQARGQGPHSHSHPSLPLDRLPSSTSDDFGDFVDAPPSAALAAATDDGEGGPLDPLLGQISAADSASTTSTTNPPHSLPPVGPPPPLALDPLSFTPPHPHPHPHPPPSSASSPHPHPHAPQPPTSSKSLSSLSPLPPTPSTASASVPPPLPPKPASNLVDEVLEHERGGLALFSGPGFRSGSSSREGEGRGEYGDYGDEGRGRGDSERPKEDDAPPLSPPKPRSPWTSRSATPTPHSHPAIAYQSDRLLSPTPVYAATMTPPNTAANPGGVFLDHPLAPSPNAGGRARTRTPPKVTTPHLPLGKLSSAYSSTSNLAATSSNSSSSANANAPSTGSGSVEETLKHAKTTSAETEVIAHHLGLIDDDYFSSREPADASALVVPVPVPSVSRSRSRGANENGGGVLGSLLGGSSPSLRGGGTSPSLSAGSPSVGSRGGSRARDAVSGAEVEWRGGDGERLGEAGGIMRRGRDRGDRGSGEGGTAHHEHRHHQHGHQPKRTPSSSSYGTSGLWGLWKGASGPGVHASGSPEERHSASQHGHGGQAYTHVTTTSPQPIGPTIVEDQPLAPVDGALSSSYSSSASASPSPERERRRSGYFDAQHSVGGVDRIDGGLGTEVHAQGKSGRALPKARMSLESIQQRWMDHGSSGGEGHSPSNSLSSSGGGGSFISGGLAVPQGYHRDGSSSSRGDGRSSRTPSPSRSRRHIPIDPPTITHTSPFAPAPPPLSSSFFTPSSLHAGFGDPIVGALVSSAASSSSTLGMGLGSGSTKGKPNPFATHAFAPIAGAPGFRPDAYDWDKGFSEELERELSMSGVESPTPTVTPTMTVTASPESVSPGEKGASTSSLDLGSTRGGVSANTGEKVYPSGGVAARGRDAARDRGRQPRPKEKEKDKHKERESSIYQTIGSAFGLWGSSSPSSATSGKFSASAPRTPPLSGSGAAAKAKSGFGSGNVPKEKDLGYGSGQYNGHGRSATTPHFSTGEGAEDRERRNGKRAQGVGELIERKVGGLELVGRKESTVGVLQRGVGDKLRAHLPPLSRLPRTWTLLYSMDQHGISLNTLYALCEAPEKNRRPSQSYVGIGGHVLIIRDDTPTSDRDRDTCFGVYIANGVSHTKTKGFYGGGDSFLFKYHAPTDKMEVFHPTGRNSYYALCDKGYVAFGGGGSSYALWVGEDLLEGSSAGSVCFGNEGPVCFGGTPKLGKKGEQGEGGEMEFEVVGLEVWGVGPT